MSVQIIHGDCLTELAKLPAESVQSCVTSPPYFGLRDYGHAGQIGLEDTPEAFVARLVEVFREVRRVLKDDGVVFLNLGDSYFGSGKGPTGVNGIGDQARSLGFSSASRGTRTTQSPVDAPSCGSDDIALPNLSSPGRACPYCGGELIDGSLIRRDYNVRIAQQNEQSPQRGVQKGRDSEHSDYDPASHVPSPASVQYSTIPSLSPNGPGAFSHEATGEEAQSIPDSLLLGERTSEDKSAYTPGIARTSGPSVFHKTDTGLFCKACGYCAIAAPKLKPKDLIGIPWMVAFALRLDGWYLRQDIIWSKPNPMPESVTDRCTKAHEYIFLLSKSQRYFYNADAIAEPLAYGSVERLSQDLESQEGSARVPGKTNGTMKAVYKKPYTSASTKDYQNGGAQDASATKARIVDRILSGDIVTRNKRSVWTVTTQPFKGAHFATFPPDLIKPCILAGSRPGDTILDPFGGSGTTGKVALELGRSAILIELNGDYIELIKQRTDVTPGLALHSNDLPTPKPAPTLPEISRVATEHRCGWQRAIRIIEGGE